MSAKKIGLVLGIIFVLVGVLGMVGTGIVGPEGTFMTNTAHDLVHLISGLILIFVAMKSAGATGTTLKVLGIIYLIVAILGFVMTGADGMLLGFLMSNGADNVLHLILGIVLLGAGFWAGKKPMSSMPTGMGM